jgi:hypothetical protein
MGRPPSLFGFSHLYMFEISAINKEGQSEPLFTGDPILAENPS